MRILKILIIMLGLFVRGSGYIAVAFFGPTGNSWEAKVLSYLTLVALAFTSKSFLDLCFHRQAATTTIILMLRIAILLDLLLFIVLVLAEVFDWEKAGPYALSFYITILYLSIWQAAVVCTFFLKRRYKGLT